MTRALTIAFLAALWLPTAALATSVNFSTGPVTVASASQWMVSGGTGPITLTLHGTLETFIISFLGPPSGNLTSLTPAAAPPNGRPFGTNNWGNIPTACRQSNTALNFFFCDAIHGGTLKVENHSGTVLYEGTFASGTLREFIMNPSTSTTGNFNFGILTIDATLGSGCLGPQRPCPTSLQTEGGMFALLSNKGAQSTTKTSGHIESGSGSGDDITKVSPIPEPNTLVLLGSGLMGLATAARRKLRI